MIDEATFRKWALALPDAVEMAHFEKPSFRINKKIFATLDLKKNRACLKLSLIDQSVFCTYDNTIIYPVPGAWGKKGFTFVELERVRKDLFKDALKSAYQEVAGAKKTKKK